ncbi:unnamed protein product [Acanthoscelides obtectus]|uniref:Uncharacterized protein n=1 Tax=Acanthoscelides obtectus TaxID=200917 RepID=A0A9P0K4Q7_ACAOB|nr:unnamed protein product [Acanthoscelides obtectus]CAK1648099.1 hypothetical protein AOBTE_LOCUS15540 [Acanthoscelides obtectus]
MSTPRANGTITIALRRMITKKGNTILLILFFLWRWRAGNEKRSYNARR